MKSSNIGGQAVLEGIMMKNGSKYAVAVRKPDGEIEVKVDEYKSIVKWDKITKIPFVRGVFNFIDSMVLGMKTLTFSASFYEEEETEVVMTAEEIKKKERQEDLIMTITMIGSVVIALGLFMVLPYFISSLFGGIIKSRFIKSVIEALIRIALFVAYVLLISKMEDIQRVFMYHGAEHKCINCIEHGLDLTVKNVMVSSRQHKRCGTSFLLIVMVVSIIFFFFIHVENIWLRVLIRVLLMPIVAGVAYEFIRLAGRSDNKIIGLLSKPGIALQKLTTKEPTEDMVEVAIAAVEAVFDWRTYLNEIRQEDKQVIV